MPKSSRRPVRKNSAPERHIVITQSFIDRSPAKRRVFKTLAGARKWAHARYGRHQETDRYVVDAYGSSKMTVTGATLRDLFPEHEEEQQKEKPAPCESCGKITGEGMYSREGEWDGGRLSEWQEWHPYCARCGMRDAAEWARHRAETEAKLAQDEAWRLSGDPRHISF